MRRLLNRILDNRRIVHGEIGPLGGGIYWGFENAEGQLGIKLFTCHLIGSGYFGIIGIDLFLLHFEVGLSW